MQIDLLHYAAPPVVGGVESVIAHHARLMADAGHIVRILAGRGGQFDERIPVVSLPLVDSRHPQIEAVKGMLDQGLLPPEFERLVSQIHATLSQACVGTHILIAHNVCSLNKNLALTAALNRLLQSPKSPRLILWHHDLAWTTPRYRAELYEGYPWDLLRRDWPGATQVVISEHRQRELAQLLGVALEHIRVIPNGLDVRRFLKLEEQTVALIERLDLLSSAPLLLLPVRITPRKNIELALRVLACLRIELPEARLVVTGPLGPHNPANRLYFDRLLGLRAELGLTGAAHFLAEHSSTYLPDAVIADFYRLADGLLLPSREEGFGLPILEAGLSGMPIFCADIPALRELGGEQRRYFSPDADPQQVASMIAQALAQEKNLRLRWRVRREFTWERIFQAHIAPLLTS